jgi:membrane protein DedA with SNARE-associated domain
MPIETIQHWIDLYGYFGLYFALVLGIIGLPIPDESLLTLSGYLISTGRFHFVPTFCAAFFGSLSGITISYWIGRAGGYKIVHKYGHKIHLTEDRLHAVNRWFDRIGKWTLTIGYFIPGVRHFTALIAGASQLRYPLFALFAYIGGFIWSLTFITLGYYLGESWTASFHTGYLLPITIGVVIVFIVISIIWYFKRREIQP